MIYIQYISCIVYTVHSTLYYIQYVFTIHCIVYSTYTVHCTVIWHRIQQNTNIHIGGWCQLFCFTTSFSMSVWNDPLTVICIAPLRNYMYNDCTMYMCIVVGVLWPTFRCISNGSMWVIFAWIRTCSLAAM